MTQRDTTRIPYDNLTEIEKNEVHEEYNRTGATEILTGVFAENITDEQIEAIQTAPAESEQDMSNLHLPSREEIIASMVRKVVQTGNTKVIITSVEELKRVAAELKEDQLEGLTAFSIDSILRLTDPKRDPQVEYIIENPKVLFDYLKGAFSKEEEGNLKDRLLKFKQIFDITAQTGQLALHETARDNLINLVKEQEAAAIGHGTYINEATIEFFRRKVADRNVYWKPFRDFPRLIPDNILSKLKEVQEKGVFEEFWILYLDYADNSSKVKSTASKIKEKDPILFGKLTAGHSKCFYIADWEDPYCDLTLDKFVTAMTSFDPAFTLPVVQAPTPSEVATMLIEKNRQKEVLIKTNSTNYKVLEKQEGKRHRADASGKRSMLSRLVDFFS